jgi:hypothetical protein
MLYGGRIGVSPDEKFDVGISCVWANQKLSEDRGGTGSWQSRTMVDLDFRWLDLPDFLGALDFELWWMELTDTPAIGSPPGALQDAEAFGGVVQFNFATPIESLSVSLGYEFLHEEDGIVFGNAPIGATNPLDSATWSTPVPHQTRQSIEVTPLWALGDHVIVDLSWRCDWSTQDVFVNHDKGLTDFAWLAAWEWYYYF